MIIRKTLDKIVSLPVVRSVVGFSRRVTPPGFEGHSLYEVTAFFYRGLWKGDLQNRASSMAFNFFLAIFPTIIFLFTLIAYVPIANFQESLLETIHTLMPENLYAEIKDTIDEIILRQNGGLLSFGFIAAIYFSKNGLVSMMDAFNNSVHVRETRAFWQQQLIAIGLLFMLTMVLIAGTSLIIGSELMLKNMLKREAYEVFFITFGRWVLLGVLFVVVIGFFYRYGPAKRRHKNFISPGVLLATFLIIGTSYLFTYYVNNFGNYNKLYGSIGTIIVFLLLIYFNSIMLLIGFELDAGIYSAKARKRTLLEQEEIESKAEEMAEEHADEAARNA